MTGSASTGGAAETWARGEAASVARDPAGAPAGHARAPSAAPRRILLDRGLSLDAAAAIAAGAAEADLAPAARRRIEDAHSRMLGCMARGALVYGITTGFGPLADRIIAAADCRLLQENLIAHLATGVGARLGWAEARAVLLARLRSILEGVSGASPAMVETMLAVLASGLAPAIPEKGTVGASGDLTPLAHMALSLMGRAPFVDRDGQTLGPEAAFARIGCRPLDLAARDGLALVNGTSAMTGLGMLNAVRAGRLLGWGERLTAGLAELLAGRSEAWHPALMAVRPHPGQGAAAAAMRAHLRGSGRVDNTPAAEKHAAAAVPGRAARPPQDAYTLRCAPQVLGACRDALAWHDRVVEIELNAATDNPIFPDPDAHPGVPPALHGGNFMGQHVAFASDALSNAVICVAGLAERQIARLTDEGLNGGLPAFLHRGPAGLNSGFMGAQVTATALHAEMRARAIPASIQSIPTNAANQDVVSMGTIAARKTREHIADAVHVHAILALALAQGVDILDTREPGGAPLSPSLRALWRDLRRISPPLERDRPLAGDIAAVADRLAATDAGHPDA